MNINAQELTLVRKNMKFGETPVTNPQPTTVTEPPVEKPESGLNALDAQAQNNIAFQGVKLPTAVRKGMTKMMLLAALAGGAMTMTSCEDEPYVVPTTSTTVINNINVDMSAWTAVFNQMLEQQKITNEQLIAMNAKLNSLYQLVLSGQMSAEEFYKEMFGYMTTITLNQNLIIEKLVENGKSQEEANAWLAQLVKDVQEGNKTYEQALEEIMSILGSIDNTLKDILKEVAGISEKMTQYHGEYMAAKDQELAMLTNIYKNGKIQTEYLASLDKTTKEMNEKLTNIEINTKELLSILTDEEKYAKFMADLKALMPEDIDYAKFEAMFNMFGLKIEDVINMSSEKLVALIQEFQTNYLNNEAKQSELLAEINGKLDILKELPNINIEGLQASIDALAQAYQAGNKDLISLIKDIIMQMDKVLAKLDTLIDNTSGLTQFFADQKLYWADALKNLEKGNQMLDKILKEQKVTNEYLNGFKADFADIKANQKTANSYLNILVNKVNDVEKAIKEIDVTGGNGMTREEFLSAMEERDARVAAEFRKFIEEYGFDKVPGDVQTIKEFLAQIKDAVKNQNDYSAQLDKIIALEGEILSFLQGIDFSNPEHITKLEQIIEILNNWKCNCECGGSSDKNDESIKDMEDMFS